MNLGSATYKWDSVYGNMFVGPAKTIKKYGVVNDALEKTPNTLDGTEFACVHNYSSTDLWSDEFKNKYGRVLQFGC
jgi:hypothetical protein